MKVRWWGRNVCHYLEKIEFHTPLYEKKLIITLLPHNFGSIIISNLHTPKCHSFLPSKGCHYVLWSFSKDKKWNEKERYLYEIFWTHSYLQFFPLDLPRDFILHARHLHFQLSLKMKSTSYPASIYLSTLN